MSITKTGPVIISNSGIQMNPEVCGDGLSMIQISGSQSGNLKHMVSTLSGLPWNRMVPDGLIRHGLLCYSDE